LLLDQVIEFEPNHKTLHQVRYYLNIASQIEAGLTGKSRVDFERCEPHLSAGEEARGRARLMIEQRRKVSSFELSTIAGESATSESVGQKARENRSRASTEFRLLAINPGATNSTAKRWPSERFAAIADRLSESAGFETVIVGSQGDREVAQVVAGAMRTPSVVLAGETSIAELKAVLSWARLVISNDTGTAHVSAALGVPTVVVFGPTEHIATRPLSKRAVIVRHDVECSPCMLRECPIDHRCMTGVRVDDVYQAASQIAGLEPSIAEENVR
jgi:ADP-heptose:LPS heptosyltransferase